MPTNGPFSYLGIVPKYNAHCVENIGDESIKMLEMFRAAKFEDFSLEQWLARTPATMISEYMSLTGSKKQEFLKGLSKEKTSVKPFLRKGKSMADISS